MKPLYISVDCEFTDGNFARGQLMQLAMVEVETGESWRGLVPITTDAYINDWVRENLSHLVSASLMLSAQSSHLQEVGRDIPAALYSVAESADRWIYHRKLDHEDCGFRGAYDLDATLVAYCGGYDFGFTQMLFQRCGLPSPFHFAMLDIGALAFGLFPELKWDFNGEELRKLLDMPENPNPHDALADAEHQAEMFRRLMKLKEERCSQ